MDRAEQYVHRQRIRAANADIELHSDQEFLLKLTGQLEAAKGHLRDLQTLINDRHECISGPRVPFDPEDKWFSSGGACIICNESIGWWCPESNNGRCEYDWKKTGETCIHCGHPEERK